MLLETGTGELPTEEAGADTGMTGAGVLPRGIVEVKVLVRVETVVVVCTLVLPDEVMVFVTGQVVTYVVTISVVSSVVPGAAGAVVLC